MSQRPDTILLLLNKVLPASMPGPRWRHKLGSLMLMSQLLATFYLGSWHENHLRHKPFYLYTHTLHTFIHTYTMPIEIFFNKNKPRFRGVSYFSHMLYPEQPFLHSYLEFLSLPGTLLAVITVSHPWVNDISICENVEFNLTYTILLK